jgi:hypothetical protein
LVLICLSNYSTGSLLESYNSNTDSNSNREAESKVDDRLVQKKQKIDNTQARTIRDSLLAIDNLILEGPNCQDPYDKSIKLLATAVDNKPIDSRLKEDSNITSLLQSYENRSRSLYIISTSAAPAATAAQELPTTLDSQSGILAATLLMKSTLNNPEQPLQVAVADNKQE